MQDEDNCKASNGSETPVQPLLKQPTLRSAGPSNISESIARLKLERSGPSGNLSKLYKMNVRAFATSSAAADEDAS